MGHFSDIAIETETLLLSGEYEMNEPPFAYGDDDDDVVFGDIDDDFDFESASNDAWDYYANMCIGR